MVELDSRSFYEKAFDLYRKYVPEALARAYANDDFDCFFSNNWKPLPEDSIEFFRY